jgi:flagellar basal-body rod protein FlgB
MDLGRIHLFALAMDRMAWLDRRQQVLAENIANSDTPSFKPSDLKPLDTAKALGKSAVGGTLPPTVTNPMHIGAGEAGRGGAPIASERERHPYETTPSGNAVVIEEQMVKVAETQADFQMATSLYRKYMDMLKLALGRGGA